MRRGKDGILRDDDGSPLYPMPAGYMELLRDRDPFTLAVKAYEELPSLFPPMIPYVPQFSRPELIRLWKAGATIRDPNALPGQVDTLAAEFASWFFSQLERGKAISEARRRLETTTWSEATLRRLKRRPDACEVLAQFHREHWKIARVDLDLCKRSEQVLQAVNYLATEGQREIQHG